jgi:hypothetical protein
MKHSIGYAYPTSDYAKKLGTHGVYVELGSKLLPMASYADAIAYAQTLGTEPDRWSMDHPANASYLAYAQRLQAHHNRQGA